MKAIILSNKIILNFYGKYLSQIFVERVHMLSSFYFWQLLGESMTY